MVWIDRHRPELAKPGSAQKLSYVGSAMTCDDRDMVSYACLIGDDNSDET